MIIRKGHTPAIVLKKNAAKQLKKSHRQENYLDVAEVREKMRKFKKLEN